MPIEQDEKELVERLLQDAERKAMFNTKLKPEEETSFQQWLADQSKAKGRDTSMDLIDYDSRGLWKALQSNQEGLQNEATGHSTDLYKKPWHPTFSDQSIYHSEADPGGTWGNDESGKFTFTPSKTNLKYWPEKHLTKYFSDREPDTLLILPKSKTP